MIDKLINYTKQEISIENICSLCSFLAYSNIERLYDSLLEIINSYSNILISQLDKKNYKDLKDKEKSSQPDDIFLAHFSRLIVKAYVVNLIKETKKRIKAKGNELIIRSQQDFYTHKSEIPIEEAKKLVSFSNEFAEVDKTFQNFLKSSILNSYGAQMMDGKGAYIIRKLFEAYLSNPKQLPNDEIRRFYKSINVEINDIGQMRGEINNYRNISTRRNNLMRVISDYIGSMTDAYAYDQYNLLYGTLV